MSYQHSQKQNPKPQIIGRINLKYSPNSQIKYISQSKKRGISANAKLKNQNKSKSKDSNSIINNIITQVKKDQKLILKKPLKNKNKNNNEIIINKSHSHSPNRLINSQIKLNNGILPPKISDKKTLVLDLDESVNKENKIDDNSIEDESSIKDEESNEINDITSNKDISKYDRILLFPKYRLDMNQTPSIIYDKGNYIALGGFWNGQIIINKLDENEKNRTK